MKRFLLCSIASVHAILLHSSVSHSFSFNLESESSIVKPRAAELSA